MTGASQSGSAPRYLAGKGASRGPRATPPSLAHTGSDSTSLLAGSAGALLAVGGAAAVAARRRSDRHTHDKHGKI